MANLFQNTADIWQRATLRKGFPGAGAAPAAAVKTGLGFAAGQAIGHVLGPEDANKRRRLRWILGLGMGGVGLAAGALDIAGSGSLFSSSPFGKEASDSQLAMAFGQSYPSGGPHMSVAQLLYETNQAAGLDPMQRAQMRQIILEANNDKPRGLVSTGDLFNAGLGYLGGSLAAGALANGLEALGTVSNQTATRVSRLGGLAGLLRATGVWSN